MVYTPEEERGTRKRNQRLRREEEKRRGKAIFRHWEGRWEKKESDVGGQEKKGGSIPINLAPKKKKEMGGQKESGAKQTLRKRGKKEGNEPSYHLIVRGEKKEGEEMNSRALTWLALGKEGGEKKDPSYCQLRPEGMGSAGMEKEKKGRKSAAGAKEENGEGKRGILSGRS